MKTQTLGPFLGTNNRLPDFALHVDKVGDWLRSADNVEVTNAGTLVRRAAAARIQPMNGAHSLHMTSATTGYLVRDSVLYAITLPAYSETLVKVLTSNAPMNWVEIMGQLRGSNGVDSGRVAAGVWHVSALPTPAMPVLTTIAGGLLPGRYAVAISYANLDGGGLVEEGGVSAARQIELTVEGGLRVELPGAEVGATHVIVYLTQANGEVCYWSGAAAVGTATFDCIALPHGREAPVRFDSNGEKRLEEPLPAGELFTSQGRLCCLSGNAVYVGISFRPGYYLPAEGYIPFVAPVTVAIENQGGTYICADKTYWLPGDLLASKERKIDVLPYGAVRGTAFVHPSKPLVGWFSACGIVLGDLSGQVAALTDEAVRVTAPASGISTVLDDENDVSGEHHLRVVACGWCVNLDNKAATTVSGWGFTSTSGGYGTQADGVYALNSPGLVAWSAGLGKRNFGSTLLKRLPAVYAGMASESPMDLQVGYVDERGERQDYSYPTRSYGSELQMQRFDTALGISSTWFDLTLSNADGADFILASIEFAGAASNRRI